MGVGVGVGVGDADGDDVGLAVADGELEGDCDGLAMLKASAVAEVGAEGDEVAPWAGPTRFGVWAGWPVNSSATAAMAMPSTATAPPVATPAANERRSRRYSEARRVPAATRAARPGARPSC